MFGSIIDINENEVTVENLTRKAIPNIMNIHVVFEEDYRRIVAEVIYTNDKIVKLLLVGEIINNKFTAGVIKKPSGISYPRVINSDELELIIGRRELSLDALLLGRSTIYKDYNVSIGLNDFFGYHSAIIGNTGSGKSCNVTKIVQNLFMINRPNNAHFVIFDAYGEYVNAFYEIPGFARYTTRKDSLNSTLLKLPAYYLGVDDLAILLQANTADQLPVLEKTLKLVTIFNSEDPRMKEYKNNIIANCLLDILASGRPSTHIRDQIIAVLNHYNTETLNLDSIIYQPGYKRTLKQCLLIDDSGKMNAIFEVTEFLQQYEKINLQEIIVPDNFVYNLEDIYSALEFALISEGNINSDIAYKQNNILKTRLRTLINSEYNEIFRCEEYVSKEEYVYRMFGNPLSNIDLSGCNDRFAKNLTKIVSKLLFTFTTNNPNRGLFPINIVLEEAHRYVQNDNDVDIIGYNIFDRIAKEGRKYGTLLTLISQRPNELSETVLSQCSNFLVFRIYYPKDLEIIERMSANVTKSTLLQIKSLSPGVAYLFGTSVQIPILVKFDLPNPLPESTSVDVKNVWFRY